MLSIESLMLAGLVVLLVGVAIAGTWHHAKAELRTRGREGLLQLIASLLDDDSKLLSELKAAGAAEPRSVLLNTFLARIRTNDVPTSALMKRRIDALVNNNRVIVALLARYAPRARTSAFKAAAEKFTDYASRFRDRWQSVFEIFMDSGRHRAAGSAFPTAFADVLAAESAAER